MSQPVEPQKPDEDALVCSRCGKTMALIQVDPSPTPDHDAITYECGTCGNALTKDVRYR